MNQDNSINQIIEIFKKSALNFRNKFNTTLNYYFSEERYDDEIILHFNILYDRRLEYLIVFKKQKTMLDHIPNIKGYDKLNLSINPYKKLKFTDENAILKNIYDFIIEINFDEISCYENYGIILRNPLDLEGIYNINVKYLNN